MMNIEKVIQPRPDKITFELNKSELQSLFGLLMMVNYDTIKTDMGIMAWFITDTIYKRIVNRLLSPIKLSVKLSVKLAEAIALKIVLNTIVQGNLLDPHAQMVLDKVIAIIDQKLV